ncbi:thermonuclease family protein [Calderihabitans maritimus]|uniref:Micrococcal nuclease-like protein n=1 Tax=Calderihabitans maritimus TaxID=1246530 RepID=A0A1Z5HRI2_9FIRM|nr:thermonuclease family protein [Calderihabitans maritimus]GAW92058.1 micrococcal nuclease-like protein [Calderihabitans maritimus]
MKRYFLGTLLLVLGFLVVAGRGENRFLELIPAPFHPPGQLVAKVERVVDGDTIIVRLNKGRKERVRLIGIDTPETKHPSKGVEPYGREATAFTRRLVEGRWVKLELDVQERDRYGRLLSYVYIGDTFVNAELVRRGYARVMTVPPNVKYADLFLSLEQEARRQKRGLWGLGN